jgi:hypothetical protein
MKIFYTKMIPSLAIRLIKKGLVQSLWIYDNQSLSSMNNDYIFIDMKNFDELKAVELIRDKVVHSIQFYNRFNVLENMEIAND